MYCDVHPEEPMMLYLEDSTHPGERADCYQMCSIDELIRLTDALQIGKILGCGHDGNGPLWSIALGLRAQAASPVPADQEGQT